MQVVRKIVALSLLLSVLYTGYSQSDNSFPVSGKVTDAATGQGIRGVRITYKNIAATITDSLGNFSFKVPGATNILLVEGDGYQAREVAVNGKGKVSISLFNESHFTFSDVANMPLKQQLQSHVTNAVGVVQVNDAFARVVETPDSYLQGKVAGLNIIRRSGTHNSGGTMFLRGINSLYTTNQPLVVVDGVIFDNNDYGGSIISNHYNNPLASIDVRDIDNITVIKDGLSTYGTRGANGVILITTSRTKELGTKIDFSATGGINFVPENLPVLNAYDYRVYLSDVLKSSGMTDAEIQSQPYMNDDKSNPEYYKYHNNTDWQKQVFKQAYTKNIFLKVTGGDNIAKYALSLGYMSNEGITKNTKLSRYNMRFNGDLNLSRRMTAVTNLSFAFNELNIRDQGTSLKTNPIYLSLVKSPFLRVKEVSADGTESPTLADEDIFNIGNPVVLTDIAQGLSKTYRFLGMIGFNYEISKLFNLSTTVGLTNDKVRENFFIPRKGVTDDTLATDIAFSRMGTHVKSFFSIYNDTRLTFAKRFTPENELTARLGVRYLYNKAEQDFGFAYNSAIDELVSVGNGVNALRRIGGDIGKSNWLNTYLNVDYTWQDKYILSFNAALDGSSKFGKSIPENPNISGNEYAFLPSIAAAWIASSEDFLKNSKINFLKLRLSAGVVGNEDVGNYTSRQTYVSQNLLGIQGLVRGGAGSERLQWESIFKLNAGFDLSFWNERASLSFDAYSNTNNNPIIYEIAPSASGFDYVIANNAGSLNSKGIEASINVRIINGKKLKWDVGANIAHNKSTAELSSPDIITNFAGASYITQRDGTPNAFYGYKTNGVFVSDAAAAQAGLSIRKPNGTLVPFKGGDIIFTDKNNDKIIDEADRFVIGNPNPDWFGGFNTTLEYGRFSLGALFTFSQGNDIYNYTRNQLEAMFDARNQTEAVINRWRTDGHQTHIPKATWGDPMGNSRFSDRWIEDGSYLRLRTATISYQVPFRPGFFQYMTVYATGNNLLTLTKYKGYDPEFSPTESIFGRGVDNGLEPQFRSVQLGLKLGL
jgi:TonB-linked SusC/RagA family outer membrane protein